MNDRPTPRRPRRGASRAARIVSTAVMALLLVAGIAWAWSASTTNPGNSVTAASLGTPGSPTATKTGGATNSCTSISVTWTAVTNATSYKVERNVNGTWTTLTSSHTTTNYGDSGSWVNYEVQYRITAQLGNWSSTTPALASVGCGIGDVDDLQATFASNCQSTTLTWTAPASGLTITSYNVQRRVNGGAWGNTTTPTGLGVTTTTFTDNTVYALHDDVEYQVIARNNATLGNASNIVPATTDWGCIFPPTNVAATSSCTTTNTVTWTNPPSPATSWTIQKSVNGGAYATFTGPSTALTTSTVNDTSSTAGQNVVYRAFSRLNAVNDTVYSNLSTSVRTGFVIESIAFASTAGTTGTLNQGDTVTVTFSQPVSNASTADVDIRTVAGTGSRGVYIDATGTTAATTDIAFLGTANNHFTSGTASGTVAWTAGNTVWTWTAKAGQPAITHAGTLAPTGFTAGSAASRVKCGGTNNLLTFTPAYSGRW